MWNQWWPIAQHAAPYVAVAALLIALVLVLNAHGRRLERHQEWLGLLKLQVRNLHRERERSYVQSLQIPRTPVPPSLSGAGTVEIDDSMLLNQETRRYTLPPESGEGSDGNETE